eukprot:6213558-Pleurochrysis_carterae.AAC.2
MREVLRCIGELSGISAPLMGVLLCWPMDVTAEALSPTDATATARRARCSRIGSVGGRATLWRATRLAMAGFGGMGQQAASMQDPQAAVVLLQGLARGHAVRLELRRAQLIVKCELDKLKSEETAALETLLQKTERLESSSGQQGLPNHATLVKQIEAHARMLSSKIKDLERNRRV